MSSVVSGGLGEVWKNVVTRLAADKVLLEISVSFFSQLLFGFHFSIEIVTQKC